MEVSRVVPVGCCLCAVVHALSIAAAASVMYIVFILCRLGLFVVCVIGIDVPYVLGGCVALYGIDGGYGGKH